MAGYLLSADYLDPKIYKHDGFSASILDSFSSPDILPFGLAWDNNLISVDAATDKIYKHNSFSASILDSFSSPGNSPTDLAWDSLGYLCSMDSATTKIYQHNGFSSSILDSFSSPSSSPSGLAVLSGNIYSSDDYSGKIYKHDGFSAVILDSFSSPSTSPIKLTFIENDLCSMDSATLKIYRHNGFSSSILDSFSSPSSLPSGLAWWAISSDVTISPDVINVSAMAADITLKRDAILTAAVQAITASIYNVGLKIVNPAIGVVNQRIIFSINMNDQDKIIIPISSFSAQLYDGRPSFLSVNIPDFHQYIDDIRAKMNGGIMMIEKSINSGSEVIFWVYIENAVLEEVGDEKILILSGYRTIYNLDPKTVTLVGVEYKRKINPATEDALRTIRCSIINSVDPGDIVVYGDYVFIASQIVISGYGNRLAMELKETRTIISQETFYPAVSEDDYYWADPDFINDYYILYIGDCWGTAYDAGICFKSIEIPQGATILSAHITFITEDSSGFDVKVNIYGNDIDNADPPDNVSEAEALILTDAYQPWENITKLTDGYQCITPDIQNIIQSIIDRVGWVPGNAIQILFKDDGSDFMNYRQFKSIDAGVNYRPKLQVTWES